MRETAKYLAVAARNAKTAEDTLGELKAGGLDTHQLAVNADKQTDAAKIANTTTREALTSVQRAFVFFIGTASATKTVVDGRVTELNFILPWENAGATPTKNGFSRVVFNFLFIGELGEGKAQSRTEPEDEGIEMRDLVFANRAESGFWNDLKIKYSASEIVVDAKNKDEITRDDLRQLYCHLQPALRFWGFIVCRSAQSPTINAFNRTLFRNFGHSRGILILSDDDLRRMVQLKMLGQNLATYLQDHMSTFIRSI